ncbi:MAG: hypothetical protein ABJN36_17640 [Cyclobacteriaceae bacterium]
MSQKQQVDINIKIDLVNLSSSVNGSSELSKEKMKTSLTVSQIAYLAKLLFDAELIAPDNKSEVLTRITNSLVTKNATQISIKSLKAKFYSPDPATKLSVKKLLQNLLDEIEVYN